MSFLAPIFIILLIIIVVILFIGFSLLRGVLSIFFPFLRPKNRNFYGGNPFGGQADQNNGGSDSSNEELNEDHRSRKKIFEKEDGEYVDFEEYDEKDKK
ncbi:MAG: DUF4834 family protein [Bacteroidales bacterium]